MKDKTKRTEPPIVFQKASELVVLKLNEWPYWQPDQSVYAEGSRHKSDHKAPDLAPYPFIRGGHRYLFKRSAPRYPAQFWGEIFAYRLGCLIGVSVPPAHVAIFENQPGALIEWFYDDETGATCVLGGELLLAADPLYDRNKGTKKGHCHNLDDVAAILEHKNPDAWQTSLTDMLTLDALIGNVDRHHNNWGIVENGPGEFALRMTPAFDNGTSLAHERTEEKLPTLLKDPHWVLEHATGSKARHHLRLHRDDDKGAKYFKLLSSWIEKNPDMLTRIDKLVTFKESDLVDILAELKSFELSVPLTENRAELMRRIVETRRELIEKMMEALHG